MEDKGIEKLNEMIIEFNQTVDYIQKIITYEGDDINE